MPTGRGMALVAGNAVPSPLTDGDLLIAHATLPVHNAAFLMAPGFPNFFRFARVRAGSFDAFSSRYLL